MSTPPDPAADATGNKPALEENAPHPTDDAESREETVAEAPKSDTEVPAADTIPQEQFASKAFAGERTSDSGIQDVEISDESVLNEDAWRQQSIPESSDVIFMDGPTEVGLEDFVPPEEDEAPVVAQNSTDQSADAAPGESPTDSPAATDVAETSEAPGFDAGIDSEDQQDEGAVEAFDLETPTPDAQFPLAGGARESKPDGDARAPSRRAAPGEPAPAPQSAGRSWLKLYASAITVLCFYLFLQLLQGSRTHQLESLPDVPPLDEGQSDFYPVEAELPGGHVLALGEERRFGNILVEPLRVTYGPVEFEHWTGHESRTRPPSEESVVKLWLKFTNVSDDQEIAPFTARLVMHSRVDERNNLRSNNFLRRSDDVETVEFMYQLPRASEWELRDQETRRLKPGESFVTYAATDFAHLPQIVGEVGSDEHDLVWRLHIRKGYGPAGNGVTTLIEVAFNSSVIEVEPRL